MSPTYTELETAAAMIGSRDTLGIPLGPGQPPGFLHALGERDDYEDLRIFGALLVDLYAVFTKRGVRYLSGFYGPAERFLRDAGADIEFIPADFRGFEPIIDQIAPRVLATVAAPPDADGNMSLSLHAGATVDALHRWGANPDRILVVEVGEKFPRTFGLPPEHTHSLHVDEVDVLVRSDRDPFDLEDAEPTDVDRAIAEHVSGFITDGCTLQTGIGGIPSTIAKVLAEGPGGDYGVHSEMFTTGLMHLHKAGKVTNRKGVYDGVSVTTFSAGTPELYEWLDGCHEVAFLPVECVNAPEVIAANHKMVTINGAIAVDLLGQAVADSVGGRQFSGIGGHEDFVSSAGFQLEDRALLCMPSTATVQGEKVSRLVSALPVGSIVTTPRHHIDVVVTEYGAARLRGRTVRQRALALAEIAHPMFRDDLRERAAEIPKG